MLQKWICNKCGFETFEKPTHGNSTCTHCGRGRFQCWNQCKCGKWFHPERVAQKFCSRDCGYKYRENGGKKGKHYPHLQRARIAVCPVCKKGFRAIKDYKGRQAIYCSKECWSRRASIERECPTCGKLFRTFKSENKIYCSRKCRDLAYRERTGALSHFWQGGKTAKAKLLKTSAEYKEWRQAVFERDNFTCQKCGKRDTTLEAHHIKEQCNYPKLIYVVDNGITLCHDCHKKTDNYGRKAKMFTGQKAVLLSADKEE